MSTETALYSSLRAPWWFSHKESTCNAGDPGSIPGLGRSPEEGNATTPVLLPGKFHGQRSLVGYSPQGHKRVGHNLAAKQKSPPEGWKQHLYLNGLSKVIQAEEVTCLPAVDKLTASPAFSQSLSPNVFTFLNFFFPSHPFVNKNLTRTAWSFNFQFYWGALPKQCSEHPSSSLCISIYLSGFWILLTSRRHTMLPPLQASRIHPGLWHLHVLDLVMTHPS